MHGPKEKTAFGRNFAHMCKVAVRESAYRCLLRIGLAFGHAMAFCEVDTAVPWRRVRRSTGCKDAFDQLLFYCLALRRSQYFRHQCSTGSSFRAFRFTRKGYAASVSGRAANGCAAATRFPGGRGGLYRRADEGIRPYEITAGLPHTVGADALIGPLGRLSSTTDQRQRKSAQDVSLTSPD